MTKEIPQEIREAERWAGIDRFPQFEISDFGRVRNIKTGTMRALANSQDGYKRITLHYKEIVKTFQISRLVAISFVNNPHGYPEVNHIDLDKTNNHYSNLEWVTRAYNMKHAQINGKFEGRLGVHTDVHKKAMKGLRKNVIAYNEETKEVLTFRSHKEMAKSMNITYSSISSAVITGYNIKGYRIFHKEQWDAYKALTDKQNKQEDKQSSL